MEEACIKRLGAQTKVTGVLSEVVRNLFSCNYIWSYNTIVSCCKATNTAHSMPFSVLRKTGGRKAMTSRCSRGSDTASRKRKTGESERGKHGKAQAVRTQKNGGLASSLKGCALLCLKELM